MTLTDRTEIAFRGRKADGSIDRLAIAMMGWITSGGGVGLTRNINITSKFNKKITLESEFNKKITLESEL